VCTVCGVHSIPFAMVKLMFSNACFQTQMTVRPLKPILKHPHARLSSSSGIASMSNSLISTPNLAMPVDLTRSMVNEAQAVDILHGSEYIDAFESNSLNINLCDFTESTSVVIPPQPITFVVPALIQGQNSKKFLSALLDMGSDGSFIHS